jgi:hypothetical protein
MYYYFVVRIEKYCHIADSVQQWHNVKFIADFLLNIIIKIDKIFIFFNLQIIILRAIQSQIFLCHYCTEAAIFGYLFKFQFQCKTYSEKIGLFGERQFFL